MMRPRGRPPTPSAMSSPSEPVDTVSISTGFWPLPSRMIDPLPKARSIWDRAASRAFVLSMDEPSTRRRADWDMGRVLMAGGHGELNARPALCTCFVLEFQGRLPCPGAGPVDNFRRLHEVPSRRHGVLHGLHELLEAEGFGEEVEVLAVGQVLLEGVLGVA